MPDSCLPSAACQSSVRPEIFGFEPYSPGLSIDEIRERYGLASVIKLASNENPLGTSPVVKKVLERKSGYAFRYPQAGSPRLCAAIAARHGVPASRIVAGNGSDEIIDLILRVKVRPGQDRVLAFAPCFSIYDTQSRLCGLELKRIPLSEEHDFKLPLEELAAAADERTAVVFVTSPDNPSGQAAKAGDLVALAKALPEQTLLVVDEAYIDFAQPCEAYSILPHLAELPNVAVMRTFSKAYGLAGLRLGYGVMPEWMADLLLRVKLPFSVNLLAEEAGLAALEDEAFYQATLEETRRGRDFLAAELAAVGCRVLPSQANFIMFKPPFGGPAARDVFEKLLERGIIIRPLKSYGLPDWLRVSIGNMAENRAFAEAFREIVNG